MQYKRSVVAGASEDRLESLIRERLTPGADRPTIDRRIWDLFGEEWGIMYTDLSGFSRNVEKFGIIHFLQTIFESERLLTPIIEQHDGILLKTEGDSMMVLFRNPEKSLQAAVHMQKILKTYNAKLPDEEKVLLCVGLGYGKVLHIGDSDVFGAEVNAASKLGEDTAKAWEILVTEAVYEKTRQLPELSFEELPDAPPGAKRAFRVLYKLE